MRQRAEDGSWRAWSVRRYAGVFHHDFNCPALEQSGVGVPVEVDPDRPDNRGCRLCTGAPYAEPTICQTCGSDLDGGGPCSWCQAVTLGGVAD